jgi:hypothetical protein
MTPKAQPDNPSAPTDIYYFAYGPTVNDMVRERRGIETLSIVPAFAPDFRLTFAFGGLANIVAKTGFEVHGLLMKLKSQEDLEKLLKSDEGNVVTTRTVIPYSVRDAQDDSDESSHNADDDFCATCTKGSIQAHIVEYPDHVEDTILDAPIEQLPQERYLKLIAQGMRKYNVDEDYITDHIEAIGFVPKTKPANFATFPVAKRVRAISWKEYQKICTRGKVEGDCYLVIGKRVFRCGEHDPANPVMKWIARHCHGKADCTLVMHLTVVDPDIPLIHDSKDATPLHWAWAENHAAETLAQIGISATRVYELKSLARKDDASEDTSSQDSATNRPCWHCLLFPWRLLKRQ